MYLSLYNLKSRPFELQPDPLFLWLGERHKETLFFLRYGILDNMGFLLLAGEAGTGKTTLINGLARGLKSDVEWAIISDSSHDLLEFYNEIVTGFGLDAVFTSKVEFFIQFSHFLHRALDANKKVVLFVDDCHLLSQEILDELRLLSNIQKGDAKLIDIFFVGQPEFTEMLAEPCNHSIEQQLALKAKLVPFSANETGHYIRHRLKVSGAVSEIFTSQAVQKIHSYSQGVAREINIICERALQAGGALEESTIDERLIVTCMKEPDKITEEDQGGDRLAAEHGEVDEPAVPRVLEGRKGGSWLPYTMFLMVCLGLGFFIFSAQREISSVSDPVGNGVAQEAVVTSGAVSMESGRTDSEIAAAVVEPEPLQELPGQKKSEVLMAQAEETEESGSFSPVILGGLDGSAGKRVVEETAPERPVDEETVVAETSVEEASAKEVGTGDDLAGDGAAEEVEALEITAGEPAVEGAKVPEGAVGEAVAGEIEVRETIAEETAAEDRAADTAVAEETTVKEIENPSPVAITEVVVAPEEPPPPPMKPEKVLLGLQPNTLKLTREANKVFAEFVDTLLQYPDARVLVKGYVSSNNDTLENVKLSEKRAATVQQLLVKHGVAATQIEVKGMGIQDPIATNDTRAGRLKNRRVEIEVIDDGV